MTDFRKIAEDNCILEVRVGSHLLGTNTPESDLDVIGIFMPPKELLYGLSECNEVSFDEVDKDESGRNTKDAVDKKYYNFRKFMKLALQNNPNILHVMFADKKNILKLHPIGARILDMRHAILHRECVKRFIGYANGQMHQMKLKPENYFKLEAALEGLEGADDCRSIGELLDPVVSLSDVLSNKKAEKHIKVGDLNIERNLSVKRARKMIALRLSKATSRKELYTKFGYDTKFASNLIQLLLEGREIIQTGTLVFPLAYAHDILDIKQGRYTVQEIDKWALDLKQEIECLPLDTLQKDAPRDWVEGFMVNSITDYLGHTAGASW